MIRQMNSLITLYGKKEGSRKGMVVGIGTVRENKLTMGVSGSILNHKTRIIVLLSGTKTALGTKPCLGFTKI